MVSKGYTKAVGEYIAKKRLDKGLKQADCAKQAEISRSTMSDIEKGLRLPSGKDVLSLCGVLGITPNDIFSYGEVVAFDEAKKPGEQAAEEIAFFLQSIYCFYKLNQSSKKALHDVMYKMALNDHGQDFAKTHADIQKGVIFYLTDQGMKDTMLTVFNGLREKQGEEPVASFDIDSLAAEFSQSLMNGSLVDMFAEMSGKNKP